MNTKQTPPWSWWARNVIHNVVVHPWLPVADALDSKGYRKLPRLIYLAHDWTSYGLDTADNFQ